MHKQTALSFVFVAFAVCSCKLIENKNNKTKKPLPLSPFGCTVKFINLQAVFEWKPPAKPKNVKETFIMIETNTDSFRPESQSWKERNCSLHQSPNVTSCTLFFEETNFCGFYRVKTLLSERNPCLCPNCQCVYYSDVAGENCVDQESHFTAPLLEYTNINDHSVSVIAKFPRLDILCKYPSTKFGFHIDKVDQVPSQARPTSKTVAIPLSASTLEEKQVIWHQNQGECSDDLNKVSHEFVGLKPNTHYNIYASYKVVSQTRKILFYDDESDKKKILILTDRSNFADIMVALFVSSAIVVVLAVAGIYSGIIIFKKWKNSIKEIPEFLTKEKEKLNNNSRYEYDDGLGTTEEVITETPNVFDASTTETHSFSYVKVERHSFSSEESKEIFSSAPPQQIEHYPHQSLRNEPAVEYTTVASGYQPK